MEHPSRNPLFGSEKIYDTHDLHESTTAVELKFGRTSHPDKLNQGARFASVPHSRREPFVYISRTARCGQWHREERSVGSQELRVCVAAISDPSSRREVTEVGDVQIPLRGPGLGAAVRSQCTTFSIGRAKLRDEQVKKKPRCLSRTT